MVTQIATIPPNLFFYDNSITLWLSKGNCKFVQRMNL